MSRLVTIVIVGALAWYGYDQYRSKSADSTDGVVGEVDTAAGDSDSEGAKFFSSRPSSDSGTKVSPSADTFACDGRQYCSQMTSCAEATYFLQHCPNVKMDGGRRDGVPCESQWCGNR
jgi:Excalibur calcium-binding domain